MNNYLKPLIDELKYLNNGILIKTPELIFSITLRARLLCVACDVPAARKVCGFMGHNATQGCSRCKKAFPRRESNFFLKN